MSDHLPQYLIAPEIFSNPSTTKLNIIERYWSKFDEEIFILGYLSVDWDNLIKSDNGNVVQSFVNFLTKFNSILDMYAPLKKIFKQKLNFRNKQWITLGIQKSILIKNNLLTKYIKLKMITLKNEAQIKYNQYRNLLSTLMKESKRSYFINYFQNKLNYLESHRKVLLDYRKDSKLKFSSYRPISLLSNIDKVLQRLMYIRLYNILEMNCTIYDLKFCFRQKYLTSYALIHLTDKIREQLGSKNFTCRIFIDLHKAFTQ